MSDRDARNGFTGRGWAAYALAAGLGAVGLVMTHYPMIASGLRRVQGDVGDPRLINYLLEHNYRWYRGDPNHAEFWNPPFFHPARNVAAYTDTLLGVAPVYAVFRAAGLAPDTSFQLWMMAVSVLNYGVMFHLLRRRLGLSVVACSAGAFVFAFGASRVNLLGHQQHLPHFLGLVTVDALFGLFPGRGTSWRGRAALWLAATAGLLAQLTAGYYLGWFLVLSLAIAAAVALWMPSTRGPFLAALRRDAPWLAASAVLGGLVMRPWLSHHLAAAVELGPRYAQFVRYYLPHPATWLYTGPEHWLERWTARLTGFKVPRTENEQRIGIGLVTTLLATSGLVLKCDRPSIRLLTAVAGLLFFCVTIVPTGPVFALEHLLILGSLAFAYSGRRDDPQVFFVVVGLVLVFLHVNPFPTLHLLGDGLFALVLAASAFVGRVGGPRGRLVLGGLVLGLTATLFPTPLVLALGAAFGAALAASAAFALGWRSRPRVEALALGGFLTFAALTSYAGRPVVWQIGAFAPLAAAAARLAPVRPPSRPLPKAALAGLVMVMVFHERDCAWFFFYINMPGANALLFVSRVGLMMLIPWGVGLGLAFDALLARGRAWLALGLGAVCLAEQGVSTASFDKAENRATVSALARRVGGRDEAFYYSPHRARWPSWKANLDAMWAGLECGKPTLNGYSGGTPVGWRDLEDSNADDPCELSCLQVSLDEWRRDYAPSVGRVRWVGGPSEWEDDDPPDGG